MGGARWREIASATMVLVATIVLSLFALQKTAMQESAMEIWCFMPMEI